MMPPAAPRWRTSSEMAGEGQALVGEPDGRAGHGDGFRGGARETFGAEAVVVADQDAACGLFGAHDVARDGVARLCGRFRR